MIYLLLDSMYMGSRLNYEYTDISPANIFVSSEEEYVISNFGLQLPIRFNRPMHCATDNFYENKIFSGQKVMDLYSKSYVF